jgi:hypothetical protein
VAFLPAFADDRTTSSLMFTQGSGLGWGMGGQKTRTVTSSRRKSGMMLAPGSGRRDGHRWGADAQITLKPD